MTWTKDRGAARARGDPNDERSWSSSEPMMRFASGIVILGTVRSPNQNLRKSRISLKIGRLDAGHASPSVPPVVDLPNRFNEAVFNILFCRPSQLERGSNRRIGRRLARFDPPRPCYTTTRTVRPPASPLSRYTTTTTAAPIETTRPPLEPQRKTAGTNSKHLTRKEIFTAGLPGGSQNNSAPNRQANALISLARARSLIQNG